MKEFKKFTRLMTFIVFLFFFLLARGSYPQPGEANTEINEPSGSESIVGVYQKDDLEFTLTVNNTPLSPKSTVEVVLKVQNNSSSPITNYPIYLLASEHIMLEPAMAHNVYQPLISSHFSVAPYKSTEFTWNLWVQGETYATERLMLASFNINTQSVQPIIKLILPIQGDNDSFLQEPQTSYWHPTPPTITCENTTITADSKLSYIGQAVKPIVTGSYFSQRSTCSKIATNEDWILDIPNIYSSPNYPNVTTAEQFYTEIAGLILDTEYTFSLSTLASFTHDQTGAQNLFRQHLSPAILQLHNSIPANATRRPLLRFLVSQGSAFDSGSELYEDLTYHLKQAFPDESTWKVSIAVQQIGDATPVVLSPWNHSKIAVRDYEEAIVGGMNWDLNYVVNTDVTGDGQPDQTVTIGGTTYQVTRLHDLSLHVEGEVAKIANQYFDLLWKRGLDPVFPWGPFGVSDCKTSWLYIWSGIEYYDCPLFNVYNYSPTGNGKIPDYSYSGNAHVVNIFGLGRGNTDFIPSGANYLDQSGDNAILAALGASKQNIYIAQHQLTSPYDFQPPLWFSQVVVDALKDALVRRAYDPPQQMFDKINTKIIVSEAWGASDADNPLSVYDELVRQIGGYAGDYYATIFPSSNPHYYNAIQKAVCRLQFATYRANTNTPNTLYFTHEKFVMFDEKAFYVASQNLYPSAIGDETGPELNEYGLLVDDIALANQVKTEYWDILWQRAKKLTPTVDYISHFNKCQDGQLVYDPNPGTLRLGTYGVSPETNNRQITWSTYDERAEGQFYIYKSMGFNGYKEFLTSIPAVGNPNSSQGYNWSYYEEYTPPSPLFWHYWLYFFPQNSTTPIFLDVKGPGGEVVAVDFVDWDVQPNGLGDIKVTWETGWEANSNGFRIFRNTVQDLNTATLIHEHPALCEMGCVYEWVDTEVENGQLYYYWLAEVDVSGMWDFSPGMKSANNGYTSIAPTQLMAQAVSNEQTGIILQWQHNKPSDYTFNIYRSNSPNVVISPANLLASQVTTLFYTDMEGVIMPSPNGSVSNYYYTITAVDSYGVESAPSNIAPTYSCGLDC